MPFGNIPPFFTFYGPASATSPGYVTTGAQTFAGAKTFTSPLTITDGTGGAEVPFTVQTSDGGSGKFTVENGTGSVNVFNPFLKGVSTSTGTGLAIAGISPTGNDTGSNPLVLLRAAINVSSGVTTRPLLVIQNGTTSVLSLSAAGGISITGGTTPSLTVGAAGTAVTQERHYTPSLTPALVAANTSAEQTFTVTGLTTADKVFLNPPAALGDGLGIVGVRVSAADTLAIRFGNFTAGGLTPVSGTYQVVAIRS